MTTPTSTPLTALSKQWAVLLTTHKRDGTGVGTPVNIAVEGDHAYVRTYATSGKAKRLRRDQEVEIAPADPRGRPTGPETRARMRLLDQDSEESRHAAKLLDRKYPITQRMLVPLAHRMKHDSTLHYELRLPGSPGDRTT
ncbi:PPOX class F420-dependent oxidoreductase [Streptomyces sp. NPDC001514]